LIGNYDWKGGFIKLSTYDISGKKAAGPFELAKMGPKPMNPFGVSIIRHDTKYDQTTIFDGFPAKRNWYPLASDIYQELIPSMGDAYPYPIKILFIYMGSPVYSLPGGHTNIDVLSDPEKIPLVVASDIVIGETSMYADYIFPDLTNLERWEFAGSHPSVPFKVQPVRQPTIAPLVDTVQVYGREMPLSLEALILGCAEKLGLPNFGPNGLGEGMPLTHMEDLYIRMAANLAFGEEDDASDTVSEADDEELRLFEQARRHLPDSVFDARRWQELAGPHWRRVVYLLNRGGRFQAFEKGYKGDQVANKYGKLVNLYQEKTAGVKSAMTGEHLLGFPAYIPAPLSFMGEPLDDEAQGYDLNLITFREISQTKSRSVSNYWLLALLPQNSIFVSSADARRLGLGSGDLVRILSPTNTEGVWDLRNGTKIPMIGQVKVIEGIRPGVVAFSLGYGHFAYGSRDVTVNGQTIRGDPRRGRGLHGNAAMRLDPVVTNTSLSDPVGASAVFYDTRVKLQKVT
jgi:anaerobic selenocysteine-containing dehydrogenase